MDAIGRRSEGFGVTKKRSCSAVCLVYALVIERVMTMEVSVFIDLKTKFQMFSKL